MVDSGAAPGKLTSTEDVMAKFVNEHPNQENAGDYYNQMTGECYDDFLVRINFTDPYKIADAIANPPPADSGAEGDFGYLNLARDAKIFDIGQGTGLLGKLLHPKGFTNIEGADASSEFCTIASESGWYSKGAREFWFGKGVDKLP